MLSICRVFLSVVFVLGMLAVAACGSSASNTGTAVTPTAAATNAPTPTPTASTAHFKVGQTVKVGDTWEVTIHSVKTSQGSQYVKPKAGDVYLTLDVTLKNISSQEQQAFSGQFNLRDATGQQYNESFFDSSHAPPNGKVEPQALLRGQIDWEVPQSQHAFTVGFQANFGSQGQTVWDIMIS